MSSDTIGASGLEGRYAAALFELAESDELLDRVADDLGRLKSMIDESGELGRLVRSPVISRADQVRAMSAIMERAEMEDLSRRFVGMVARNRRLFALRDMISAYLGLVAVRRGEAKAEVTSAAKLTGRQLDAIAGALRKVVGTAVALDVRVDPGLLGGLIVKLGSRMVDGSLSTKLQRLHLAMRGIG